MFCSINISAFDVMVNTLMQNLKSHQLPLVKSTALSMQKAMLWTIWKGVVSYKLKNTSDTGGTWTGQAGYPDRKET